jgi:hypothetical protein
MMRRRDWSGIAASIFGLVLLAALILSALPSRIEPLAGVSELVANGTQAPPCPYVAYERKPEMCAQWVAAEASLQSARWSFFQLLIGVGSAAGLLVALSLTVWSNSIARRALATARETSQRQLRAYVFPTRVAWEIRHSGTSYALRLSAVWKNMGQTPTRDLEIIAAGVVTPTSILGIGCEIGVGESPERYHLGPNGEINGPVFIVPEEDLDPIWKSTKFLYLSGLARYKDVLEDAVREARFCYQIILSRDNAKPLEGANFSWIDWHVTGPHNCADGECFAAAALAFAGTE